MTRRRSVQPAGQPAHRRTAGAPADPLEARVLAALHAAGLRPRVEAAAVWSIAPRGARRRGGTACIDGDWLVLDTVVSEGAGVRVRRRSDRRPSNPSGDDAAADPTGFAVRAAAMASGLPDAAKLVLDAGRPSLHARCELPLRVLCAIDDAALGDRIRRAADGLAGALAGRAPAGATHGVLPAADADATAARLGALCAEAGWSALPSPDGAVRVDLESRSAAFRQARVTVMADAVRVRVELTPDQEADPCDGRTAAIALLLLRVAGTVRMVRPWLEHDGSRARCGLDVALPAAALAAELDAALAALSLACDACAAEVDVLAADAGVADAYLARCGPVEEPADTAPGTKARRTTKPLLRRLSWASH